MGRLLVSLTGDLFIKSCWQGWLYGYSGSPLATRLLNLVGVGSGLPGNTFSLVHGGGGGGVLVFLTDSLLSLVGRGVLQAFPHWHLGGLSLWRLVH